MTRSDLVAQLAERFSQLTHRDTEFAVKTILDAMSDALARGHRIEIRGFGSFSINRRPPRVGRNPRSGEQVVIDFQDALQGPRQYDLVALLRDSYVELDRPLIDRMLRRYLEILPQEGGPSLPPEEFIGFFDLLTVQRKLKDAGRFVFIDQVKKNPSFLAHIPSSLRYVRDALKRRPELREVQEILIKHVPELRG